MEQSHRQWDLPTEFEQPEASLLGRRWHCRISMWSQPQSPVPLPSLSVRRGVLTRRQKATVRATWGEDGERGGDGKARETLRGDKKVHTKGGRIRKVRATLRGVIDQKTPRSGKGNEEVDKGGHVQQT